jgi:hypothetical protein
MSLTRTLFSSPLPPRRSPTRWARSSASKVKVVVDATNFFAGRGEQFEPLAHEVEAHTSGPAAEAFNANAGVVLDQIDEQQVRPGCLYGLTMRRGRSHRR